jgi:hypothetical protein
LPHVPTPCAFVSAAVEAAGDAEGERRGRFRFDGKVGEKAAHQRLIDQLFLERGAMPNRRGLS